MLVRDVMTSPAVTVSLDTPIKQVAHVLDQHAITALPVVDGRNRIVGVVSEADVLLESVPPDPRAHEIVHPVPSGPSFSRAEDVMSFHPVTVAPSTDLAEATELMTSATVKSLPVVDDGVVVGVVSRRDVVRVLARADAAIAAEVGELLRSLDEVWPVDVEDGVVLAEGPDDERGRDVVRALATTVPGVVAVRFA
jgi:CBS domain-containing protein